MGFVCDLHSTPLLARRGFPLAFRVGARWVSTPSSMPRLGAQFPLFVEFLRGLSAISASGKRCHVAQFSHWRPPLRLLLHTHCVLRVVVVSSSTCCCHLRLRPNSRLNTKSPVFRRCSDLRPFSPLTRHRVGQRPYLMGRIPRHSPSVTAPRCCWSHNGHAHIMIPPLAALPRVVF